MPRPETHEITFTIDDREVTAPENMMLADAAKYGDIEIPVFCYERKLGDPVGACRMCLVEIEGIPKLQTACSTAVKDGMVVHTNSPRVKESQRAVVEFLLINHPLDCPVCDKGGECPLQDITFGWGPGFSRYIEPKRHFVKPLELSPLIAIDRERCILCYRCVRFSQEVSEDYQLVFSERGAHTFVSTYDGHPYVAPFTGNITELCPVGALTSIPYRFRARPWDIEDAGTVCTQCPSQCNVSLTVRDDQVLRVRERAVDFSVSAVSGNADVDDGWLCDKGRFSYQSFHVDERITQPLVRDGGELRPVSWERALEDAAAALNRARGRIGALAGGGATNEEGFLLQRLIRGPLESPHLDSRASGALPLELHRALAAPALQATVPDLEFAHAVLVLDAEPVDDMAILELRLRKGARRNGMRLAVATSRPSRLDDRAEHSVRIAPGGAEAFVVALDAALAGRDLDGPAAAAGVEAAALRDLASFLRGAGEDVVILYGERLVTGPGGENAARALLNVAGHLNLAGPEGAGLLEVPMHANGRGLREVGVLPTAGPGYSEPAAVGLDARGIAEALAAGELSALYLMQDDPILTRPDRPLWARALEQANAVIAHASFLSTTLSEYATVVFPAEAYPEKLGTITHPDGRLQRLRAAVGHAGAVQAEWEVLQELSRRLGAPPHERTLGEITAAMTDAVGFYAGLDDETIGGLGVRWQERDAASKFPEGAAGPFELATPPAPPQANGRLRAGTFRTLWASKAVDASPSMQFLHAEPLVELSPADAQRLDVADGDPVEVEEGGYRIRGVAKIRDATPAGTAFIALTTTQNSANTLPGERLGTVAIEKVRETVGARS
jgi:NADH-quinone oxidoreductase subunit G